MSRDAHKFWLKVSAVVIGLFGPFLFLATMPGLTEPARLDLDILAWPIDGFPSYQSDEIRFLSALTGGFLLGWSVTIWFLSERVYDRAPEAARQTFLIGVCAWFVLDSAGSVTSGNPSNAAFNLLVLLVVVGPMWRPARDV
ncbi:MAG: hypothetical protein HKN02_13325 [Rhodobacteraceae bacterium]|nr:hypothetical protein [Paracoccaceae bacterium]